MAKRKLNLSIHNPNPVEVTADYILKVMIEANTEKGGENIAGEYGAGGSK